MEKKNWIIGGSIAAVVLIGASVGIGIAVSGKDSYDYATSAIQTYSYKADSSTTDKAFSFVGLSDETITTEDKVMELINSNKAGFHEIVQDKEMTDGVISNHGIGFGNSGIIGYTFTNGSAQELTVYDDATTVSDTSSLAAVLDINMKVPVSIADVLRGHLASETTSAITSDDLNVDSYYDAVMSTAEQQLDFAVSFGFYNYATYSATAEKALEDQGFDTSGIEATATLTDQQLIDWYNGTFAGWNAVPTGSEAYSLKVDGSSTPNPAMNVLLDTFNSTDAFGFDIVEELNNNGSGAAWAGGQESIPGGPVGSEDNVGGTSIFLGTQSRNTTDGKDDHKDWGYETGTATVENADGVSIANNAALTTEGAILQTTMAVDSVSFFTAGNTVVLNPVTGEYETPTGITKEGIVEAYESATSWNTLAQEGQIIFN